MLILKYLCFTNILFSCHITNKVIYLVLTINNKIKIAPVFSVSQGIFICSFQTFSRSLQRLMKKQREWLIQCNIQDVSLKLTFMNYTVCSEINLFLKDTYDE